jgi:oxygen-dependent protoporphyrinogen oxidase
MTRHAQGPVRTVVVGGGITGLGAAHRLLELSEERGVEPSVLVLEAGPRLGGQIRTEQVEGHLLEAGPDTLLASKPAGVSLCRRLGLGDELAGVEASRQGVHVLHRGRLIRLPSGLAMMAPASLGSVLRTPLFSTRGKLRMALERFVQVRDASEDDESLTSFVTRRFGREVFERVAEPIIASLYTADADRLGVRTTMPRFLDMERRYGSITRAVRVARDKHREMAQGRHAVSYAHAAYLTRGFGSIVDCLVERVSPQRIRTEAAVESITRDDSTAPWTVRLRDTETIETETVVLACPGFASSRIVADLDAGLASDLNRLDYADCATLNLVYRREDIDLPGDSFGFFVPRSESVPFLACSFVSEKFPGRVPEDQVLLRVFVGGARSPEHLDPADAEIEQRTHEALSGFLAIRQPPVLSRTRRNTRSMPQYDVGYSETIDAIRNGFAKLPGLFVAGTAVGAFGLPDCIASGESAAAEALDLALGKSENAEIAHG